MREINPTAEFFDTLGKILLRCWIFGFALLFLWTGVAFFGGDLVYSLHGGMFGLSPHELDLIFYGGIGLLKVLVLLFFFFPWLAIKTAVRRGS